MSILYYAKPKGVTSRAIYDEVVGRFYNPIFLNVTGIRNILNDIKQYSPEQIWVSSDCLESMSHKARVIRNMKIPVVNLNIKERSQKNHAIYKRVNQILIEANLPLTKYKGEVKPLFFLMIDKCISEYLEANDSIKDINRKYPLVVISSGLNQAAIEKHLPECIFIDSKKNSFPHKLKLFLEYINHRNINYNIAFRLDMDCIIFDVERLIEMGKYIVGRKVLVGNLKKATGSYVIKWFGRHGGYIRGGCNMTTKESLDSIKQFNDEDFKPQDFDACYNIILARFGVQQLGLPIFEFNERYQGQHPAWHPIKLKTVGRMELFKQHNDLYNSQEKAS